MKYGIHAPTTSAHEPAPSPCRRGCCWTPHGHSTVVDNYPDWHTKACRCHKGGR